MNVKSIFHSFSIAKHPLLQATLFVLLFSFSFLFIKWYFSFILFSKYIQLFITSIVVLNPRMSGNETMDAIVLLYSELILLCYLIVIIVLDILIGIEHTFTTQYGFDEDLLSYGKDGSLNIAKMLINLVPIKYTSKNEAYLDFAFIIFPTIIVAYIIVPTLGFLYNKDINVENSLTSFSIHVVGHQWYWNYRYNIAILDCLLHDIEWVVGRVAEFEMLTFDSILDISSKSNRLLSVDNVLVIPTHTNIKLYLTSEDVIHSWAVPQLGIKVDTIPGRITTCNLYTYATGTYVGQCSELCGANHGFMPIVIESVNVSNFFDWYAETIVFTQVNFSSGHMNSMF